MRRCPSIFTLLLAITVSAPIHAQRPVGPPGSPADTAGAFLDAGAAALMKRARDARFETDASLRSYTAVAQARMAAGLRMPMKDRTLFRSESAARIRWSRDGDHLVQLLAGRTQTPAGVSAGDYIGLFAVDPYQDRLYFGLMREDPRDRGPDDIGDDDDFYIEHPLGEHAETHYRYRSGDTMTVRLQDGRSLRVVELQVLPRRSDPRTVRGTLWLEEQSAAVVRAAFRLARKMDILRDMATLDDDDLTTVQRIPLINPLEFDLSLMTLEYSLWDMKHWLPRSMRIEGLARAGVFVAPASFELSYRVVDAITEGDAAISEATLISQTLAEWRAEGDYRMERQGSRRNRTRVLVPRDSSILLASEHLPPPIWENAPGFMTERELREMHDRVAAIAGPARPDMPVRFGWGLGEPGMVRYNRVEALSVGARLTVPLPHVTLQATARLGAGDLHPNAELLLLRETMRRTFELRAYHQLTAVDEPRRALGAGNSLSAFLLGRDEGEYYRATGASLTFAPPPVRRRTWEARLYAEAHDDVERNTHIALPRAWDDVVFRENIAAWEMQTLGALLQLKPWWGTDPLRAQFGFDARLQYERVGIDDYGPGWELPRAWVARSSVTLRAAAPLPGGLRIGAEAGGGYATGAGPSDGALDVPPQRLFYLGGASTLRGYEPSTLYGPEMLRGRLELARALPWGNLAVFTDYGRTSSSEWTNELWAAGAGLSVLDGLVRIDVAHGIGPRRGWQGQAARRGLRIDLHLDSVL